MSFRAWLSVFEQHATAVVLGAAAVLAWSYGLIDPAFHPDADLRHYGPMAEAWPGLSADRPQPFAFRPLGPWLAGLVTAPLGLPVRLGFYAWALPLSLALAALTLRFLKRLGLPAGPAALATVLFLLNPYLFGFNIFNAYHLGDLIAQLVVIGGLWLVLEARYVPFAALLALGVLAREPAVLVPVAGLALLAQQKRLWNEGAVLVTAAAPAAFLFVALRLWIPHEMGNSLAAALAMYAPLLVRPDVWYRLLINVWAPLTPLLILFSHTAWSFLRAKLYLVVLFMLVLASTFLGGDVERLMQPASVAVYAAFGAVIARHLWRPTPVAILLVAGCAAHLHHLSARFPLPSRELRIALSLAALGAVATLALAVRLRERRADAARRAGR